MALVWLLAGCTTLPSDSSSSSPESTTSTTAPKAIEQVLTLGYIKSDELNPLNAKTGLNLEIGKLLYEGLVSINEKMMPVLNLAASVDTANPAQLTAVLRADAAFSDGQAVTAEDVVASFNKAKASANYKVLLSNLKSATAQGKSTVVFTLSTADVQALSCLSFPVLKDPESKAPIGSGRYVFKAGETPTIIANPRHRLKPVIQTIRLVDTDGESAQHALESGMVQLYYSDLSGGEIPRTSHASGSVPLNYLVYIGMHSGKSVLSKESMRKALSYATDRDEVVASAFAGRAHTAVSPFHPLWESAAAIGSWPSGENLTLAVAQLQEAGYNNTDKNAIELELLVPSGNSFRTAAAELLAKQWTHIGVKLTVTELSFSEYTTRLKKGDYDLYLGEIRLPANMSLRSFFSAGGSTAFGIKTSGKSADAYASYLKGDKTLQEFCEAFSSDMPYMPLCFRQGMVVYSRSLGSIQPSAFDVFQGIESWSFR